MENKFFTRTLDPIYITKTESSKILKRYKNALLETYSTAGRLKEFKEEPYFKSIRKKVNSEVNREKSLSLLKEAVEVDFYLIQQKKI